MTSEAGENIALEGRAPLAPVFTAWGGSGGVRSHWSRPQVAIPPFFAGGAGSAVVPGGEPLASSAAIDQVEEAFGEVEVTPDVSWAGEAIPESSDELSPGVPPLFEPGAATDVSAPLAEECAAEPVTGGSIADLATAEPMTAMSVSEPTEEADTASHDMLVPVVEAEVEETVPEGLGRGLEERDPMPSPTGGREVRITPPVSPAAHELATRLEAIAARLRTDGTAAVVAGMRGDRLDALLSGVFAGYLAARELDQ